ncbi:Predicted arabinose efflux permease, MFS family [Kibdelosporangium aridum]|uniref:Predicted arabinose efflux permease, MFS family n=1 Tax=Kibdelosporangium aridum TaxID=2030 RepID=A0A1Y5XUX7_KIBAR|nr:Predicted arabinose efflux permease, MFS family [Kibdelosporangium aridum]
MRRYAHVLKNIDFRRLWLGATVSTVGDGITWVALTWLVLSGPGGVGQLGLLAVCYTAPVALGGLAVGPLLDRFDKRTVLLTDSLLRAAVVGSIPAAAAFGALPGWLPFVVAATHGLLKMVPLAGFPAAIPQLVDDRDLDAANALETLSYGVAGIVGPAAAGLLLTQIGAANILIIDSATFLVLALAAASVRQPLRPPAAPTAKRRLSFASVGKDRAIIATTVSFMAFNVAEGMLVVTAPWLADTRLPDGPAALGLLLSALAVGEFVGATVAGARQPRRSPVRAIGVVQIIAAAAFLTLLSAPRQLPIAVGFFLIGLLSAPMTIWAQSLRMRRIPKALHGRAFATLRTLMQATPMVGSALVTPMLAADQLTTAAVAMVVLAGLPALYLLRLSDVRPAPRLDETAPDLDGTVPGLNGPVPDLDRPVPGTEAGHGSR